MRQQDIVAGEVYLADRSRNWQEAPGGALIVRIDENQVRYRRDGSTWNGRYMPDRAGNLVAGVVVDPPVPDYGPWGLAPTGEQVYVPLSSIRGLARDLLPEIMRRAQENRDRLSAALTRARAAQDRLDVLQRRVLAHLPTVLDNHVSRTATGLTLSAAAVEMLLDMIDDHTEGVA